MGLPQSSHFSSVAESAPAAPPAAAPASAATAKFSGSLMVLSSSAVRSRVLRHLGYPPHPMNGPRRPIRTTMLFLLQRSHLMSVSTFRGGASLPSASMSRAFLHFG